ncbi:hepcidin-1-like [Hyperolius riggenbachi]|uniref:hepcidin-1-like n=1 Tax=Hyperolius riggenbachi TaxID=752182 RepID=UPI0035A2867C
MKSIILCLILIITALCHPGLCVHLIRTEASEVLESTEYSAFHAREKQDVQDSSVAVTRGKRHTALSICVYCCKCCRYKGCGYCCRT